MADFIKKHKYALVATFLVLAIIEVGAYFTCQHIVNTPIGNQIFFLPPEPHALDSKADFHGVLGWDDRVLFGNIFGARHDPAFPPESPACVSVYGCSFAYSAEVANDETWAHYLSKDLQCRADNYGNGFYGTDQGFLDFCLREGACKEEINAVKHMHAPRDYVRYNKENGKVVILTFMDDNAMRTVNQFRYLYSNHGPKPRFYPYIFFAPTYYFNDDNELKYAPPLPVEQTEVYAARSNAKKLAQLFPHDYFRPYGPSGKQPMAFPYTYRLLRVTNYHDFKTLYHTNDKPFYYDFNQPGHASKGFERTLAIMEKFAKTARENNKIGVVVFIPHSLEFTSPKRSTSALHLALIKKGIYVHDTYPDMRNNINNAHARSRYTHDNHPDPELSRVIASSIGKYLKRVNISPDKKEIITRPENLTNPVFPVRQ